MGLTAERLRQVLTYEPETGIFRWSVKTSKRIMPGEIAGSVHHQANNYSRRVIRVDGQLYSAHRLAWLYVHGQWPEHDIDHKNGDSLDNRLSNLRAATRTQNMANKKIAKHNSTGVKGVQFISSSGRYRAVIRVARKNCHIGCFATKEEAGAAYFAKAKEVFGEYASDGRRA